MLVAERRPRNLAWYHSAPLLFGDWGTSRLYVLGLAFFYTAHASALYLAAMCVVMTGVAWAYSIICRCFPDGGGVYTGARQISHTLSVIGATLLLCDYIVTASLSTLDGFRYLGAPDQWAMPLSIAALLALGVLNWFGARSAGRFALIIALLAIAASLIIAILVVPYIRPGLHSLTTGAESHSGGWARWQNLVRIMLALSGVEAVSNMTGIMKEPVVKTARRTIWPVLIEVVILNMVFVVAMCGLEKFQAITKPDYHTHVVEWSGDPSTREEDRVPEDVKDYRDTAVRVLAQAGAERAMGAQPGSLFTHIVSIIFGLLLISASNTAIMDMVAVQYALGRDRELPRTQTKLNYSGVPKWALVAACAAPILLLCFNSDVMTLGELYAVGVVGAITINVLCAAINRKLDIKRWERIGLFIVGGVMAATELTIAVTKLHAAVFAGGTVLAVMLLRLGVRFSRREYAPVVPEPVTGWLAELQGMGRPKIQPGQPRIMLAARGRENAEFAIDVARRRGAVLFAIFVRVLRVIDLPPGQVPRIEDDPEALEALGGVAVLAKQAGVPFFPIYVVGTDIMEELLDYTVTFGCDALLMGKTRRSVFARAIQGDVVSRISHHLPEGISLITRAGGPIREVVREPAAARGEDGEEPPPS
jgi:amino acid transporter/nucleotide-binding universal stress UspA family protein